MSRQKSNRRLERRPEREAKQPEASQPRPRRQRQQNRGPRRSGLIAGLSNSTVLVVGGVLLLVAGLVYLVVQASGDGESGPAAHQEAQENDDPQLPGRYVPPHAGADGVPNTTDDREHVAFNIPICTQDQIDANGGTNPICYTSNPPTSGPHAPRPMEFAVLENPAPRENLVHNMEHGGVVIWYNTTDAEIISQIEDIAQGQIDRRRFVVSSSYAEMEAETIAVTSWTRLDKFPVSVLDEQRILDFISEHHKRFNPEGF